MITQSLISSPISISHNDSHFVPPQAATESTEGTDAEKLEEKSSPNFWSVMSSVDDGNSAFGMPQGRSVAEKKADSLQLVVDLIDKVNACQLDFATADSKALKQIHTELSKVSQLVRNFLEYSTNLINDEGIFYCIP